MSEKRREVTGPQDEAVGQPVEDQDALNDLEPSEQERADVAGGTLVVRKAGEQPLEY